MIVNRSSKFNEKGEFWHNKRQVLLQRQWGGIAFKGPSKFVVVLGEEFYFNKYNYYILCEASTENSESLVDIIELAVRLEGEYKVDRWFGRLEANVKELLAILNKQLYSRGNRTIVISEAPRTGEYIDENITLVHGLVRPYDKRLHFFSESMIPGELKSMPMHKIRADEFPRATALSNAIAGMLKYGNDLINPSDLIPEPEGLF